MNGFILPEHMNDKEKLRSTVLNACDKYSEHEVHSDHSPWYFKVIIFKENSKFTIIWHNLYVFASVVSSLFYCYIIVIGKEQLSRPIINGLVFFDIFFLLCIIKKFLTEFTPVGEINP